MGFLSPSSTFVVAVFIKTVIGGTLVFALGAIRLPSGEFSQYVTTFEYMGDVLRIWAIFIVSCVLCVTVLRLFDGCCGGRILSPIGEINTKRVEHKDMVRSVRYDLKALFDDRLDGSSLRLFESCVYVLGFIWISFFVLGVTSGSLERGLGYDANAARIWRLTDIFIVFSRLKVVYFYLCGLLITSPKCRKRFRYLLQLLVLLSLAVLTGGRGEVFFGVGAVIVALVSKKGALNRYFPLLVSLILGILLYIPIMGAIRETPIYKETSISKPTERIMAIVSSAYDVQGIKYRISTLGREVYACSDAFLFHPNNLNANRAGFADLDIKKVATVLFPKAFHGYAIEKFDGSRIAQKLMGVEFNRTWYPCISTPGDIYRRSSDLGLVIGGCAVGLMIVVADLGWRVFLDMHTSWGTILLVVLPLSFIQSFPFGTIQETIWIWGWDLPKYVLISLGLSLLQNSKLTSRE